MTKKHKVIDFFRHVCYNRIITEKQLGSLSCFCTTFIVEIARLSSGWQNYNKRRTKMNNHPDYLDYFRKAYFVGDDMDLKGFMEGFLAAARIYCQNPCLSSNPIDQQHWVYGQLLQSNHMRTQCQRLKNRELLEQYAAFLDCGNFHGMIFDCADIDSDGQELDPVSGEPTTEHHPWEARIYQHRQTGAFLYPKAFDRLEDEAEKRHYVLVRVYDEPPCFPIFSNDINMMAELIRLDILRDNPGINDRYFRECSHPRALLYEYRQVIKDALEELAELGFERFKQHLWDNTPFATTI